MLKMIALIAVLGAIPAFAAKDTELQSLKIDSTPPGAKVVINGRERGVTPFEWKLGRWAFEIGKKSVFAKRLSEPLTLEVSMPGYRTETLQLTRGPMTWRSFDGKHAYNFWVINAPAYNVRMRPVTRTLTNDDVLGLIKAGLVEELIIDKIKTSACEFKTDPEDLKALHDAGVSDSIISAMLHALPVDQAGPESTVAPVKKK